MTSTAAADFLTKELFINNNIVTFRSLSRELGIHVDQAKNELATFHTNTRSSSSPSFSTYLVSGEVSSLGGHNNEYEHGTQDDRMDVDLDEGEPKPIMDIAPCTKMILSNEDVLEETKAQFSRVYSIHVYSLSPSPIHDAGLVCGPTVMVRQADATGGSALSSIVGKIVGAHVKMGNTSNDPSVASTSNTKLEPPEKPKLIPAESRAKPVVSSKDKAKEQEKVKPSDEPPRAADKPKATGKLDWSKAKSKESKKPEPAVALDCKQAGTSASKKDKNKVSKPREDVTLTVQDTKRGKKRKSPSALLSDSEGDVEPPQVSKPVAQNTLRVKKGMIMSDDEDEDVNIPKPSRVVKKAADSDSERSLRAMMDIDDVHVIKASKSVTNESSESDEDQEEDVEIAVDSEEEVPKPKPRKKSEKKVVPIGRNGLKKKRVTKSRTTTDAKGYMITEDYSSYESVDDDEPDSELPAKGKGKKKTAGETKPEKDIIPAPEAPKPKTEFSRASKAKSASAKRGSLLNFFGPERGKK